MGILQQIRVGREIKRLRKELTERPQPQQFVALAQLYLASDQIEDAAATAELGLSRFPESMELSQTARSIRQRQVASRVRSLRRRLASEPSPSLYAQLGRLQIETEDFSGALETAAQCAARYPGREESLLIEGDVRLRRFRKDRIAADGLQTARLFEAAVRINPRNTRSWMVLAKLYFSVGAYDRAATRLERYLACGGERDQVAVRLLAQAREYVDPSHPSDLAQAFQRVEERGHWVHDIWQSVVASPVSRRDEGVFQALQSRLGELAKQDGIVRAMAVPLNEERSPRRDDAFERLVTQVAEAAYRSARRMDLGSFRRGIVEGPFGKVLLTKVQGMAVGVLCDRRVPSERLLNTIENMIAAAANTKES
ncbi:MAG: hypothetical protein RL885_21855 [Planctomycetota bacterium]